MADNMSHQEVVSGTFVLTPAAGKKLIGIGVAALPEVQYAFKNGRLAIANGTTTGYVVEALRGKPVKRFEYCVGLITGGICTENPNSDHTLLMWIEGKETIVPFPEFLTELRKFGRDDVFIKGANAVDPNWIAGGLQTNPNGGSWADAFGLVTARGFNCVVPVGLEKMIPSVIEASKKMGQARVKYNLGSPPGLIPLPSFKVITEVQALESLAGVKATPAAGGGIGGSEGSKVFVVEGTEAQVKKAFTYVTQVCDEPPTAVTGDVEPTKPPNLPEGL